MPDMKSMGYNLTFLLICVSSVFSIAQFANPANPDNLLSGQAVNISGGAATDTNIRELGKAIQDLNVDYSNRSPLTPLAYLLPLGTAIDTLLHLLYSVSFSWINLIDLIGKSFGFPIAAIGTFNVSLLALLFVPILLTIQLFMYVDVLAQIVFFIGGRR